VQTDAVIGRDETVRISMDHEHASRSNLHRRLGVGCIRIEASLPRRLLQRLGNPLFVRKAARCWDACSHHMAYRLSQGTERRDGNDRRDARIAPGQCDGRCRSVGESVDAQPSRDQIPLLQDINYLRKIFGFLDAVSNSPAGRTSVSPQVDQDDTIAVGG